MQKTSLPIVIFIKPLEGSLLGSWKTHNHTVHKEKKLNPCPGNRGLVWATFRFWMVRLLTLFLKYAASNWLLQAFFIIFFYFKAECLYMLQFLLHFLCQESHFSVVIWYTCQIILRPELKSPAKSLNNFFNLEIIWLGDLPSSRLPRAFISPCSHAECEWASIEILLQWKANHRIVFWKKKDLHTNLLSLKNGKLCQQKFWPCHENRPRQDDSNDNLLYVTLESFSLYCAF